MKGIVKIQGGYRADHYWGKPNPLSESFYAHTYGSDEAAEAAAARWLAQMENEFPAPPKKRRMPGMSYTYERGGSGNKLPCVLVFWTSYPDEENHTKKFYYNNDLEKAEAEHKANIFYQARLAEFEQ